MNLVSWNLNGLEDSHLDVRTEAAMFQILLGAPIEKAVVEGFKPNTPDVILLQEVVERSYHAHVVPHLKAAGFAVFPPEIPERSYFEVVAIRKTETESTLGANYESFEYSEQSRGLTTFEYQGVTIMTAHMESMKPGKHMRVEQAKTILEKMHKSGPCIFAGDTNLRKAEWESLDHGKVIDAWTASGSVETQRMTWFYENYKSRFDRAWFHQLKLKSFETFGKNNIPTINTRPSDHLGLRLEVELK